MRKTDMGFRAKHGVAGNSWAVANGHAFLAGKFYDLPYCIKKVLVDEFDLLRGYNKKHPEGMIEWYIFFGEVLRIADNKGVFEEFRARIAHYSERYPWNISAARPDAVDVPERTLDEIEEERIREEKRLKKKAMFKKYYDEVLAKRRGATPRKAPGQSYAARKAREYERRKQLRREAATLKQKEMADA